MLNRFSFLALLGGVLLTCLPSTVVARQNDKVLEAWRSGIKTLEDLNVLHDFIVGDVREQKWLTIAWHSDLLEAQAKAQNEGRPLFVWAMNGDPLGCV